MVEATIVTTAVLLGAIGMRAERNRRLAEVWACVVIASILLVLTAAGHASGQVG